MKTPPYLKKGDTIALVAPARKISVNETTDAVKIFNSWGLKVISGRNLYNVFNQFAGTDGERAADFQYMLDHPDIKAIVCARGGYGSVRIIDRLDFSKFVLNPKWIVGYSDITVFHSHIQSNLGIETMHAEMPVRFSYDNIDNQGIMSLKNTLFGYVQEYKLQGHILNSNGCARGVLTGGNLSMLYSLTGSVSDINTDGKILFIEDIDEYLYHIDRMMMNLKRSGKLENLAGLIVGGMTGMNDNAIPFGETAYDIISRIVINYNYPKIFGFPAGHIHTNMVLIMGREYEMEVTDISVKLK